MLADLNAIDGLSAPGYMVAEIHNGHLLAIEAHAGLVMLDWNSRAVFALNNHAHHDLDTDATGAIPVLTALPRRVDTGDGEVLIIDDIIQVVSVDGVVRGEHSVFEILAGDPVAHALLAENLRTARYRFNHMDEWREAKIANDPTAGPSIGAMFALFDEVFVQKARTLPRGHQL